MEKQVMKPAPLTCALGYDAVPVGNESGGA